MRFYKSTGLIGFLLIFISGLLAHPAWTLTLFYVIFASNVSGEKVSASANRLGTILLAVFVGSIVAGFAMESPEASRTGARPLCDLEVLIYGSGALAGFLFLLRKGILGSGNWDRWRIGLSAGLISALTMQLACMYDPWPALLFHYGPTLILALLGGYAIHLMKKHQSPKNLQKQSSN